MSELVAQPAIVPSTNAIRYPEFCWLLLANMAATSATYGFLVIVGIRIVELFPNQPLIFGAIGLVQAVPLVAVSLLGGHLADSSDRKQLLLFALAIQAISGMYLCYGLTLGSTDILYWVFPVMFWQGFARGLTSPATMSLEAELVPASAAISTATWSAGVFQASAVASPILAGTLCAWIGVQSAAFVVATFYLVGLFALLRIASRGAPIQIERESIKTSIQRGLQFVFSRRILWASMTLDLFAVFFGGAVAMMPLFAFQILHAGKFGTGCLIAAPLAGAFLTSMACLVRPPKARVGRMLLASVFAFGVCMIVFSISKSFWLSIIMLFLAGAFDGFSVVIRRSIIRLFSPNHMRGRVAAVNTIFVVSSNELGEFESGMAADLIGLVPSVAFGGVVSIAVVVFAACISPELRRLDFRELTKESLQNKFPI